MAGPGAVRPGGKRRPRLWSWFRASPRCSAAARQAPRSPDLVRRAGPRRGGGRGAGSPVGPGRNQPKDGKTHSEKQFARQYHSSVIVRRTRIDVWRALTEFTDGSTVPRQRRWIVRSNWRDGPCRGKMTGTSPGHVRVVAREQAPWLAASWIWRPEGDTTDERLWPGFPSGF